ncbi:hypothetical protein FisN_6Lh457 [Fistulifera solaris]|uniref:Uncharacterized protein n=1 Tax=Fistulifera solaris TaxID=1519565 RepID=A0A1Z5JT04_FISSO|nr:hypothetical protein FisN_6Lh457 [Fistulifera solaris]|eukprot:GAX17154.1 hypothetical protein FisN_6Lh457 [Fistulifera solaris]
MVSTDMVKDDQLENTWQPKESPSALCSNQSDKKPRSTSIECQDDGLPGEVFEPGRERSRAARSRSISSKSSSDMERSDLAESRRSQRRSSSISRHQRTTRGSHDSTFATERVSPRRSSSPRRSMHRRSSTGNASGFDSGRNHTPRRGSLADSPFSRRTIRSTGGPRRRLSMPRVGDVVAQVPTLSTSGPSTPVTPRPVTRHSSAQLQIVSPPILKRSQSAGTESERIKTPQSIQGSHGEQSIRQHRSSAESCHQNSSDDAQRSSRKSSSSSSPKKSPSRRRTVVRSLAGLQITIELQQALFPSKWMQTKSQLWYQAYALTSHNEWTEKVSQIVAIAGTTVSPVTLQMSLSCDEAKDFLKNEEDYKPIELRIYNGPRFLGSIPLPMHTTESSWFFSIEDSPFEVCAYITLEGSTMHDLDAGSVLKNIPTSCYWHCSLPISAIAITKKHGLVQWDECLSDLSHTNKSGSLERQSTSLRCNLKNLPESVAALFFVVVNDSSEPATCRLEERIGLGRMKVPASQITLLGRITLESNGFEMMALMKSFPIISDLGALIPMLHMCACDIIQDPFSVSRTAWMQPGTCIHLLDYCPRLISLVIDIRCKKGDVMALFLDERGQRVDVVDQHHTKSRDRSATMTRKMIELELHRVGMRVQTIAFITTAEFSCHVWDPATEAQLIRFTDCPIDPSCGYKHILVGCLNRSDESYWDFWAIGSPTKCNSLHALCDYVYNLHPSPKPSSLFAIEPFDVPAKSYIDSSDGVIFADRLLKAMKTSSGN